MKLVEKFVAFHMAKCHPEQPFQVCENSLGHFHVTFPGRNPFLMLIKPRRPVGAVEMSNYLRDIGEDIDKFLVDPLPWQLWSAYV